MNNSADNGLLGDGTLAGLEVAAKDAIQRVLANPDVQNVGESIRQGALKVRDIQPSPRHLCIPTDLSSSSPTTSRKCPSGRLHIRMILVFVVATGLEEKSWEFGASFCPPHPRAASAVHLALYPQLSGSGYLSSLVGRTRRACARMSFHTYAPASSCHDHNMAPTYVTSPRPLWRCCLSLNGAGCTRRRHPLDVRAQPPHSSG